MTRHSYHEGGLGTGMSGPVGSLTSRSSGLSRLNPAPPYANYCVGGVSPVGVHHPDEEPTGDPSGDRQQIFLPHYTGGGLYGEHICPPPDPFGPVPRTLSEF
jgi:hypothetical protein